MTQPHAIVIGASSGGVAALMELATHLPRDLNAVVGIVLHVGSQPSILPELLTERGVLPACHAKDGERLRPGTIYVAPPDQHMLFDREAVRLNRGPRENYTRPAIDPLFRSTALAWRERAIGVILTGVLDDGTAGLKAIKECGGKAVVQDPADAIEPGMPASALAAVAVDHCVALRDIPAALLQLVRADPAPAKGPVPQQWVREQAILEERQTVENLNAIGEPSALTCPDCGGGLWELHEGKPLRYRCHTGHAFTALSLENAQTEMAEHALWSTVRALQEREILLRRLASVAEATGDPAQAQAGRLQAEQVRAQAQHLIRMAEEELRSP